MIDIDTCFNLEFFSLALLQLDKSLR